MVSLKETIKITSDCKYRRTFHSDQGWAYQMKAYVKKLKENGIIQSMSRKDNYLDNSPMENFFGIMKQEMFYGEKFESADKLIKEIKEYIRWYNEDRIKKNLNGPSPVKYRLQSV
nr:IS3 family transposase [Miniphocaeibacter halophilus]